MQQVAFIFLKFSSGFTVQVKKCKQWKEASLETSAWLLERFINSSPVILLFSASVVPVAQLICANKQGLSRCEISKAPTEKRSVRAARAPGTAEGGWIKSVWRVPPRNGSRRMLIVLEGADTALLHCWLLTAANMFRTTPSEGWRS